MAIGDPYHQQLAAQQLASAQYQQGLADLGNQMNGGLTAGLGSLGGIAGHTPTWSTTTYTTPAPYTSGMLTVAFMDALGQTFSITVDAACATAMHAISNLHWSKIATAPNQYGMVYPDPIIVTPELGEFSLDEMDRAEKLIEELENG